MKKRFAALTAALLMALSLSVCSVALAATGVPTLAQTGTLLQSYQLRSRAGTLCIYQDGVLLQDTGISVDGLPAEDRAQLEVGVSAEDAAALAALLEDFGS